MYSSIQTRLGEAYLKISEFYRKEESLAKAVYAFREALRSHARDTDPVSYALVQFKLGLSCRALYESGNSESSAHSAIAAFIEALKILILSRPTPSIMRRPKISWAFFI